MRAVTWHGKRSVHVDTVPDPVLTEPTDAIIEVTTTNICGSDLHLYEVLGAFMESGDILGHEPMGVVRAVGPAVSNLRPGDRVVIPFQIACGHCPMCHHGLQTQCETTAVRSQGTGAALFGYSKLYGQVPGAQAQYLRVPQAPYTHIKVPDGPPDTRFVYLSDVLPTAWQAVEYAAVPPGGSVTVLGLGPIGDMAARIAHHRGIRVIGVDLVRTPTIFFSANSTVPSKFCSNREKWVINADDRVISGKHHDEKRVGPLDILLLTDHATAPLAQLDLVSTVRRVPMRTRVRDDGGADIAVVDALGDLAAARKTCRRIADTAPLLAVVAVVSAQDFVAVDLDWHIDDAVLPGACAVEVQTRLRLAIARRRQTVEGTVRFGDLVLYPTSYTASMEGRELDLTLTEFKLLSFLIHNAGRAFTRTRLMHEVWGHICGRRTVDVHIQRLRAKLGPEHESIVDTVRGVGYMAVHPERQHLGADSAPMAVGH